MSHTALARRYRPRSFSEVAVQQHVSETLRRAVHGDRVGHAYLFCGPRGVGKTTLARVLAMALNCGDREERGEPCGECENCLAIWNGATALDVVEIDAASNRGVDDARDLRERAMYAPSDEGRTKVYIVDEAHMLTREAWNALLKILEEPPPRVVFIFATTEPQKIEQSAAPILSRCQRFDFRRLGVADIVARLKEVLRAESAAAPDDVLTLIARKADGGMRDALSILDQVLALSDDGLTTESVGRVLGVIGEERYYRLFELLSDRDRLGVFELVQELLDDGSDLVEFYFGLMDALRILLRARLGAHLAADRPGDSRARWEAQARRFEAADLVRMLGMAAEVELGGSLRRTAQPRVLIELLLLRFTYLDRTLELEELFGALGGEDADGGVPGVDRSRVRATSPAARHAPVSAPRVPLSEDPASDTLASWQRLLARDRGLPDGMRATLREADARVDEAGSLELRMTSGRDLERLRAGEGKALEKALGRVAGRPIPVRLRSIDLPADVQESAGARSGSGRGRLGDLLEREPGLRPAVEMLDLELVD